MLNLTLLVALLAQPSLAAPKAELVAQEDAAQTYKALSASVAELTKRDWDSPTRFKEESWPVMDRIKKYCKSMDPFPKIQATCDQNIKAAEVALAGKQYLLVRQNKVDTYGIYREKISSLSERAEDLRAVEENGEPLPLSTVKENARQLSAELKVFCAAQKNSELPTEPSCAEIIRRIEERIRLAVENREIPRQVAAGTSKPRRTYRDTTPMIRCLPKFPDAKGRNLPYVVSDPSGAYRYSGMRKSEFGYAFEIPLKAFESKDVNDFFRIVKKFSVGSSANEYEASLWPQFNCPGGGDMSAICKVNALGISLSAKEKNGKEYGATSSHILKPDVFFSSSIKMGSDSVDSFGLDCMVAGKSRVGG
ncbi:MAG: hypothetical protein EOP11_22375, partial [Proteobacteria bacterium]